MSTSREEDASKEKPEANYAKSEEHVVGSYEEAKSLADAIYSDYSDSLSSGLGIERTCEAAKVRIRRRTGSHGRQDDFRVVLSKAITVSKAQKPTTTEELTDADADGSTPTTKAERRKEVKSNRRKSKSSGK